MDQITRIFIDTSKQIFQLHGVDAAEVVVLRKKLRRGEVMPFFSKLSPTVIGLEACGASHHWARALGELGHEVRLIAPQHVKPYVKRNKNDARDAEGGCEAMSRPTMTFVPVKSAEQQAGLMLMKVREQLIGRRTATTNAIRGHAAEFGLVAAQGLDKIEPLLARIADDEGVPDLARELFAGLGREYAWLRAELKQIQARLLAWHRGCETSRRLAQIPGVGSVGAVMLTMKNSPIPASSSRGAASQPGWASPPRTTPPPESSDWASLPEPAMRPCAAPWWSAPPPSSSRCAPAAASPRPGWSSS